MPFNMGSLGVAVRALHIYCISRLEKGNQNLSHMPIVLPVLLVSIGNTLCLFLQNTFYFNRFLVIEEPLVSWKQYSAAWRSCKICWFPLSTVLNMFIKLWLHLSLMLDEFGVPLYNIRWHILFCPSFLDAYANLFLVTSFITSWIQSLSSNPCFLNVL